MIIIRVIRLKSFKRRFTRSFCKYDVFTSVCLDCLKRATWWYFYIILIYFWVYFTSKCALFYARILYIYTLFMMCFYAKFCIEWRCFCALEWVKYCGKIAVKCGEICLIYDWNVMYFYLFGVWFWCEYVIILSVFLWYFVSCFEIILLWSTGIF